MIQVLGLPCSIHVCGSMDLERRPRREVSEPTYLVEPWGKIDELRSCFLQSSCSPADCGYVEVMNVKTRKSWHVRMKLRIGWVKWLAGTLNGAGVRVRSISLAAAGDAESAAESMVLRVVNNCQCRRLRTTTKYVRRSPQQHVIEVYNWNSIDHMLVND